MTKPLYPALYQINTRVEARGLYLDLPPWGYHVFDMAVL